MPNSSTIKKKLHFKMSYTSKCKIRNVREEYSNTTFVENQLLKFFKYLYFFFAFFKVIHDFPSLKIFELLSFKVLWNGNGIRFQSKLEQLYKLWKLEVSHWIAQHVHADIIVNSLHGVCICNRRCFKITWKMFYIVVVLHYLLHLRGILVWSYSPSLTH